MRTRGGPGVLGRGGEGLEGANHKKKLEKKSQKSEIGKKNSFFFIGTDSKPL